MASSRSRCRARMSLNRCLTKHCWSYPRRAPADLGPGRRRALGSARPGGSRMLRTLLLAVPLTLTVSGLATAAEPATAPPPAPAPAARSGPARDGSAALRVALARAEGDKELLA